MKKKGEVKKDNVSLKNYFIVIIVSVLTIATGLYVRAFYINYNKDLVNQSVMKDKVSEVNFNELDYIVSESSNSLLYVGYTGDKNVYNMEKRLLKEIEKKSLSDKVLYLDVSDFLDNNDYLNKLKKQFSNIENQITNAPMFIFIENGKAVEAMSSELKMVDYKVFNNMISKYELF